MNSNTLPCQTPKSQPKTRDGFYFVLTWGNLTYFAELEKAASSFKSLFVSSSRATLFVLKNIPRRTCRKRR